MTPATIKKAVQETAMQIAALVDDGSTVAEGDLESFVTLRDDVTSLTSKWARAHYVAGTFALAIAIKLADIRKLIKLANGSYDAAGNSRTYALIVENDIGHALAKVEVPNGVKPLDLPTFRNRVKVARSENRVNFAVAAAHVVANDPALASMPFQYEQVVEVDGEPVKNEDGTVQTETIETTVGAIVQANPPGTTSDMPVPEVLAIAVEDQVFSQQVSADGKRLPGFAKSDIPPTWGRQPKAKATPRKKGPGTEAQDNDAADNVDPVDWSKVARAIGQSDALENVDGIRLALTALSDAVVGPPGTKKGSNPKVIPSGKRPVLASQLRDLHEQAFTLAGFLDNAQGYDRARVHGARFAPEQDNA